MKTIRAIAILLALSLIQGAAQAQTDAFGSNDNPYEVGDPYLLWPGGWYTTAPGDSAYQFTAVTVNVNNTNLTYQTSVNWGNGSWSARSVELPSGTYVIQVTFYVRRFGQTIYKIGTVQSIAVTIP